MCSPPALLFQCVDLRRRTRHKAANLQAGLDLTSPSLWGSSSLLGHYFRSEDGLISDVG